MLRILLLSAVLEACTPSPQEAAMRSRGPVSMTLARGGSAAKPEGERSTAQVATGQVAGEGGQAALGPMSQPVSAAANPVPAPSPVAAANSSAEASGRRTLSTAFVRVGPDGILTVDLRDGRVVVLRDLVMRPDHYDGVQIVGGRPGGRYRGAYADVAAARPGSAIASDQPQPAVPDASGKGHALGLN